MSARRPAGGFTLMETLVMLVLVSFAVLLMFQTLGSYRIARERILAHAGGVDRQALFDAWFRDSVHGLHPREQAPFTGAVDVFSGMTLNPLFASGGAPVTVEWRIESAAGGWSLHYSESGEERFVLPLQDPAEPRFAYYDMDGAAHDAWPPRLGVQHALPAGIALVRDAGAAGRTLMAAIPGPLDPVYAPYEMGEE